MTDNISSSEMTAYWRSEFPAFSNDYLSAQLASDDGILKAHLFEKKYNYPLVGRKVSVRAGWCLKQAVNLLSTEKYDACISLGSGFSLLTYHVAQMSQLQNIQFIDVDLPEIVAARNSRIISLLEDKTLDTNTLTRLHTRIIDLENAYQSGIKFHELFPTCKNPIFIIEGIIYFLSKECVKWIFEGITNYTTHGIIFDYWPADAPNTSKCFRSVLASLDELIPEKIRGLLRVEELNKLCKTHTITDISLQEVENKYSLNIGEEPQFVNLDEFIPVRLRVATSSPESVINLKSDNCSSTNLVEIFEQQVNMLPDKVAIAGIDTQLTYDELNRRANQLAHYLQHFGIKKGERVAILITRSVEMVITMLATVKIGGIYIPIAVDHPYDRIKCIINDMLPSLIICNSKTINKLPEIHQPIINIDDHSTQISQQDVSNLTIMSNSNDGAFILYTSGSTGKPKGVLVKHKNISNLVVQPNYVKISTTDVFLQLSPYDFDGAAFEIWGALLNGAKLALMPAGMPVLSIIARIIETHKVSILFITTQLFNSMVEQRCKTLSQIKQILFGGEVASITHVNKLLEISNNTLINGYGPTECTFFTTTYQITAINKDEKSIPIGKPINNAKLYILDDTMKMVGKNQQGELYIGGSGVSNGYVHDLKLTAEKFIKNPFSEQPDDYIFKTGDIVEMMDDGNIKYIDRKDNQVKIRGYRVSLEEIEAAIKQYNINIKDVVAIWKENENKAHKLIAHVVPYTDDTINLKILRDNLKKHVPSYMIPNSFIIHEC